MRIGDFTYELPPERIAQFPVDPRDASRLLVVRPTGTFEDARFRDLPGLLEPGDLLVVNDTRVLPARLLGRKPTGGRAEVLLLTRLGRGEWEALVRASKPVRAGVRIGVADGGVRVLEPLGDGRHRVRIEAPEAVESWLDRVGGMPLPPYIRREAPDARDRSWYQTLFARADRAGSAAAPTAGLHFTPWVLEELERRGVARASVTLHVGLGTFLPVRVEDLDEHRMHREWFEVPADTARAVNRTLERGGRVVAVGTTVTRVLEHVGRSGRVEPETGWTDLFIRPGHGFRVVSALVTNFHLPRSTLLVLVCAFGGTDRILAAYRHAVRSGYRFYSYGDAMLVLGRPRSVSAAGQG